MVLQYEDVVTDELSTVALRVAVLAFPDNSAPNGTHAAWVLEDGGRYRIRIRVEM
jgi:hypothetical protein